MATINCPTCGDPFDTVNGMATHHGHAHPSEWEDRFWFYVDVGDDDECWPYERATDPDGYGMFVKNGEDCRAHRIAYGLEHGEPEHNVLHHCDTPDCCNPAHLYDGTNAENMADKRRRGRASRGEDHYAASLSKADVLEIRERYAEEGGPQATLAVDYGVGTSDIRKIVGGEIWTHVGGPTAEESMRSGEAAPHSKITEDDVVEIREEYAAGGVSQAEIGEDYGLTQRAVGQIVNGETWADAPGPTT